MLNLSHESAANIVSDLGMRHCIYLGAGFGRSQRPKGTKGPL